MSAVPTSVLWISFGRRLAAALAAYGLVCSGGASAADLTGLTPDRTMLLNAEPIEPVPLRTDLQVRLQELGRKLYFDPALSGDQSQHCGSCHELPPLHDTQQLEGVSPLQGEHKRSTPLLYNVSYYYWFNWDGRFDDLHSLVEAAISDPNKLNANWDEVMERLRPRYDGSFKQLNQRPMNRRDVVAALTEFLRSLDAPNARFDRYLRGDRAALTRREEEGYRLFKEVGCSSCHNGRAVGGNLFETFYIYRHDGSEENEPRLQDLGRFYVTGDLSDRNLFRVPSLRNVALTAPYFHDGSAETLEEAIEEMGEHQLGILLNDDEVSLLADFLLTLTGTHPGSQP